MSIEHAGSAVPGLAAADAAEDGASLSSMSERRAGNQFRRNLRRFLIGNRLNLVGVIIVLLFIFLSIFGQAVAPQDPYKQNIVGAKLLPPSTTHLLGTDELGRDVFSRILTGTRTSLQVAVVVLGFAVIFGTFVGAVSGYFGGMVDEILMRSRTCSWRFPRSSSPSRSRRPSAEP